MKYLILALILISTYAQAGNHPLTINEYREQVKNSNNSCTTTCKRKPRHKLHHGPMKRPKVSK